MCGERPREEGVYYTHLHKFVLVCMRFALCVHITCECSCACVLCVVSDKERGADIVCV